MGDAPDPPDLFLQNRYDSLWSQARGRVRAGTVEIDPLLARREPDRRRGLTLMIRPDAAARERISAALARLRELESDQYYYHATEFHITFLSLFTATEDHEPLFARAPEYRTAVAAFVRHLAPFSVRLTGLTGSPAALMIQGFTHSATLNAARDDLREELRSRGLGASLDSRYRLESAHLTAVRFCQPLRDAKKFADVLERMRALDFGEFQVESLELNKGDWYASRGSIEILAQYELGA